jgi:hypothetical protein
MAGKHWLLLKLYKMTITLNTSINSTTGNRQCDSLSLISTLLDDWMANQGTKTLTAEIQTHCDAAATTITVEAGDVSGDGGATPYSITLEPSDFGSTGTTLDDGVYKLKFILTVDATGSTTADLGCKPVICALECNAAAYQIANITSTNIWMLYETLLYQDNCAQCSCEMACDLYDYILEVIQNSDTDDCGC